MTRASASARLFTMVSRALLMRATGAASLWGSSTGANGFQSTENTRRHLLSLSHCSSDTRPVTPRHSSDPAIGVYVRYTGGNACADTADEEVDAGSGWCLPRTVKSSGADTEGDGDESTYCTYSLSLNFRCHETLTQLSSRPEVSLVAPCHHELSFWHTLGCPLECGRDKQGRVCSDRGKCMYDGTPGDSGSGIGAHCACEAPWTGESCQALNDGTSGLTSGVTAALVVGKCMRCCWSLTREMAAALALS